MSPKEIGNIPGYYYDNEKGKYFKIAAHSSPLAYSSGNVKDRKARDKKVVADKTYRDERKDQIKRAKILSGLTGDLISREHGHDARMNTADLFADGLANKFCATLTPMVADMSEDNPLMAILPANTGRSHIDVAFASSNVFVHSRLQSYAGRDPCEMKRTFCVKDAGMGLRPSNRHFTNMFNDRGAATSISINHDHQFYTQTWLSGNTATGIALIPMNWVNDINSTSTATMHGPGNSRHQISQTEIDVNCSVAAPAASNSLFVYGTSQNIVFMLKSSTLYHYHPNDNRPNLQDHYPESVLKEGVLALEFRDDHPHILFSGNRKGLIPTFDLRNNNDVASVIHHPSAITHMRSFNHKLIVSGLQSQMCQYDTRFLKRAEVIAGPRTTSPCLSYPEHFNDAHIKHGFDVDFDSGLIAVAQAPSPVHHMVQLFSLHDGNPLNSDVIRWSALRHYHNDPVMPPMYTSLQFVEDDPGSPKSLYALSGCHLERYAWHGMGDKGNLFEYGLGFV